MANTGSNNVLVFKGLGAGLFSPARSFFAGTNPVGITIADVNGDQTADVIVANQGSNDVSVLFGEQLGEDWTMTYGPRLRVGEGPVSTRVEDVTGDGILDILVSNSASADVIQLNGVGEGFFNDQNPTIFDAGSLPQPAPIGSFENQAGRDLAALGFFWNLTLLIGPNTLRDVDLVGVGSSISSTAEAAEDGFMDMVVGNHDDGKIALLLGEEASPIFANLKNGEQDGLADQTGPGTKDAANLLAVLGIASPSALIEPAPPLKTVFILNGPGFEKGLTIPSTAQSADREEKADPILLAGFETQEPGCNEAKDLAIELLQDPIIGLMLDLDDKLLPDKAGSGLPEAGEERLPKEGAMIIGFILSVGWAGWMVDARREGQPALRAWAGSADGEAIPHTDR